MHPDGFHAYSEDEDSDEEHLEHVEVSRKDYEIILSGMGKAKVNGTNGVGNSVGHGVGKEELLDEVGCEWYKHGNTLVK